MYALACSDTTVAVEGREGGVGEDCDAVAFLVEDLEGEVPCELLEVGGK